MYNVSCVLNAASFTSPSKHHNKREVSAMREISEARSRRAMCALDFMRCCSGWVHRVLVLVAQDVQISSQKRDDGRRASALVQICTWWAIVAL